MEDDLEEKQNFLRINILEKGYDIDDFTQFLCHKKGGDEGIDMNNWQLLELKLCVKEFVGLYKPKQEESPIPKSAPLEESDYTQNQETDSSQMPSSQQPRKVTETYIESVKCELNGETELSKNDNIIIQFPEKTEGNRLFSKAYVTYLVTTIPFGSKVRKRYSDFEWLKSIFQTVYVGSVVSHIYIYITYISQIPPMPKKNYGDQFKEVFISKRMRSLEKFMQTLILDPMIKNSQILYDFLTIESEQEFNTKKAEYNKLHSPVYLNEIRSLTGEINLNISNESEIAFNNIKENANQNEHLLKKVSMAYKVLNEEMLAVSQRMREISQIWDQLFELATKYEDDNNVTDTYKVMTKLMNDWAESQKKQASLVSIDIREYFKFIKNEYRSLKVLVSKVDLHKNAYYNGEDRLFQKKEALFKKQDIAKWELDPNDLENKGDLTKDKEKCFTKMLPKETRHVKDLKQFYGYYLNSIISEHSRLKKINGKRHKSRVVTYSQSQSNIISDLHVTIADLVSYYNDFN